MNNNLFNFTKRHYGTVLFVLFAFVIIIKGTLFKYYTIGVVNIPQIESLSAINIAFKVILQFLPLLSFSILVASFVFITNKRIWIIVVNVVFDLWLISNQVYYQINELFLTIDSIKLAGNLSDVEVIGATTSYLLSCLWYPVMTCLILIVIVKGTETKQETKSKCFLNSICISIILLIGVYFNDWRCLYYNFISKTGVCLNKEEQQIYGLKNFIPFYNVYLYTTNFGGNIKNNWSACYISHFSIFHYFPAMVIFEIMQSDDIVEPIREDEVNNVVDWNYNIAKDSITDRKLIIILVESLESWPINGGKQLSEATPNLNKFSRNEHVIFFNKVKSQVKHGVSGDGQMIVNTGLLPTNNQPACECYGNNVFPNFAHYFENSTIISPWRGYWNQEVVTYSYEYKTLIEPEDNNHWNDGNVVRLLIDECKKYQDSFCIMALTSSTHKPYEAKERKNAKFDKSVPQFAADYLNCLKYTDECLGRFLEFVLNDSILSQSTIIITGDHTTFKSVNVQQVNEINGANKNSVYKNYTYTPLFVYSPGISRNRIITKECYQMDIYPTIMSLLGAKNYYWKGFGVDLLDDSAERVFTEDDAFYMSDRIIRTNYFAKQSGVKSK